MSKWVLTLREPSEEMKMAGEACDRPAATYSGYATEFAESEDHFRAMLSAAPSPLEDEALVEEIKAIILNAITAKVAARAILGRLSGR